MNNYEPEHDPLCRSHYKRLLPAIRCTDCELIGAVRRDEQAQRESFRP